jgi:hypothetical protein
LALASNSSTVGLTSDLGVTIKDNSIHLKNTAEDLSFYKKKHTGTVLANIIDI